MEAWAAGRFTAAFDVEMIAKNAGATGGCSVYDQIIDMEFDVIHGEDDEK